MLTARMSAALIVRAIHEPVSRVKPATATPPAAVNKTAETGFGNPAGSPRLSDAVMASIMTVMEKLMKAVCV